MGGTIVAGKRIQLTTAVKGSATILKMGYKAMLPVHICERSKNNFFWFVPHLRVTFWR